MPPSLADDVTGGQARPGPGAPRARGPWRLPSRQLGILFLYSLVNWSAGNGLLPLLPKYATLLGAPDWMIGYYLGGSYAAIALGTVSAGWLADRVGHRKALMVLVTLSIPPMLLVLSEFPTFWVLAALTAAVWWLAGMALTFASILAGLGAGPGERGWALGFLAVAAPLGSIIGGLGIGFLADALGFSRMWIALAGVYLLCPAAGLFVKDIPAPPRAETPAAPSRAGVWGAAFLILLVLSILAAMGSFIGALGRSLAMQSAFTNTEITSTVAASGAATLPFPFLIGFLSDRLGRLRFIAICYAMGAVGMAVYAGATGLWQFWVASALVAFVSYVSTGVSSALVVDLVERDAVGRGLALFNAAGWSGGILGFVAGGYLFPGVGFAAAFLVGAALLGIAVLFLPSIGWARASTRNGRGRVRASEAAARKG